MKIIQFLKSLFEGKQQKVEHVIYECSIHDDVEILGHVFHGLSDIATHVEMSLYRDYSHGKANSVTPGKKCDVHVGELWTPYPCFDSYDSYNENRSYSNYVFRNHSIQQSDMRQMSELPYSINYCRATEDTPDDMRPIVYYRGDGNTMVVAI